METLKRSQPARHGFSDVVIRSNKLSWFPQYIHFSCYILYLLASYFNPKALLTSPLRCVGVRLMGRKKSLPLGTRDGSSTSKSSGFLSPSSMAWAGEEAFEVGKDQADDLVPTLSPSSSGGAEPSFGQGFSQSSCCDDSDERSEEQGTHEVLATVTVCTGGFAMYIGVE